MKWEGQMPHTTGVDPEATEAAVDVWWQPRPAAISCTSISPSSHPKDFLIYIYVFVDVVESSVLIRTDNSGKQPLRTASVTVKKDKKNKNQSKQHWGIFSVKENVCVWARAEHLMSALGTLGSLTAWSYRWSVLIVQGLSNVMSMCFFFIQSSYQIYWLNKTNISVFSFLD